MKRSGFQEVDQPLLTNMSPSLVLRMLEFMNLTGGGLTYFHQLRKEHNAADLSSFLSEG